jgi:hypothetical protein
VRLHLSAKPARLCRYWWERLVLSEFSAGKRQNPGYEEPDTRVAIGLVLGSDISCALPSKAFHELSSRRSITTQFPSSTLKPSFP